MLSEDGRFTFLTEKEHFDLCNLIKYNLKLKGGEGDGPFLINDVKVMVYLVAIGIGWLHTHSSLFTRI